MRNDSVLGARTALTAVALALLLAGCSGSSGDAGGEEPTAVTTSTLAPTTTATPPETTTIATTTTTTQPPEASGPTDDQRALVEELVDAFNRQDFDAFVAAFGSSPVLLQSSMTWDPPSRGNEDQAREEFAFRWAMAETWQLGDCEIEFGSLKCALVTTDDLTGVRDVAQASMVVLQSDDGTAMLFSLREDEEALNEFATGFHAWVAESSPGSEQAMFAVLPNLVIPKFGEESIGLWLELLPGYIESLGA